jgi:DNA-binding HxlR family transcriptional regulator
METIPTGAKHIENQAHSFSEGRAYDADICIMTKVTDLISGRWKPIILYLIKNDVNRFGLLQKSMPRISKKVLAQQLKELEEDNLIIREVVEIKHPQIVVYHLTERGLSLRILIDEMIRWGIHHLIPVGDPRLIFLKDRGYEIDKCSLR